MSLKEDSNIIDKKKISKKNFLNSDKVIKFLEQKSPSFEFEKIGYEIKTVTYIKRIYLTVNPDPRNLELIPPHSLVISHHKISVYKNRVYKQILSKARTKKLNIYNFHLAWDIMEGGIADSFLYYLGFPNDKVKKIPLTYKGHNIPRLGSIIQESISVEKIISKLIQLNVYPFSIINPISENQTFGYIPGGGFNDIMMSEMADEGVKILISSDPNWVIEIVARELGITLICIDHFKSESYGLLEMQRILFEQFPNVPVLICEKIETVQLDDLIEDLINIVLKDGIFTVGEHQLIESVIKNIEKFKKAYKSAWKDGIIVTEEKYTLTKLWRNIYNQSVEIVNSNKFGTEKFVLLSRIFTTINNTILTQSLFNF